MPALCASTDSTQMTTQLVLVAGSRVLRRWFEATIQLSVKDIFTSGSSSLWIPAMQSSVRADKGAGQLLLFLWVDCHSSRYIHMYVAV